MVLIWPQWPSRRSAALGWGQISLTDNTDPSLRPAGGASAAKWSGNGRWPSGGRGDHRRSSSSTIACHNLHRTVVYESDTMLMNYYFLLFQGSHNLWPMNSTHCSCEYTLELRGRGCIMVLSFFRTPNENVLVFERIAIESAGEHNSSPVVWLTEIEVQIWRIIIQWDWINETKLCLMSSLWPATSQPRPGPGQPALGIPPQHNRFIKILFSREGNVIKWQMINCRSLCKNVRKI